MTDTSNLRIDAQRLWDTLMETAAIGGTPGGGIRRLALSEEDRRVRDWFRTQCEAMGCTVTVDEVGSMFAQKPGRLDIPPICMGSHLDTQPTGGKFDGTLGVLAGLEVLRTLQSAGYETNAPITLVNWTNEEGSRFSPAMLASAVFAGAMSVDAARQQCDREGVSFGGALDAIGYRGAMRAGALPMSAMFELHIEQGPILENEGRQIGVVTGVQGIRWYEVTVRGQDAHTGATPMRLRRNALLGAARMIEAIETIAQTHAPDAVGAVGLIENRPNSRNVVPGEVFFTVDFRHPENSVLDAMEAAFREALPHILKPLHLSWDETRVWDAPPVTFDAEMIACVERAAARCGCSSRRLVSGAGHDAANIARVAPTTMIFVPCLGGISHNETEWTSLEECGAGAQVLLQAVLDYDRRFAS